jgi:aconitase A
VYLTSPAIAAASAIMGKLANPEDLEELKWKYKEKYLNMEIT